LKRPIVIAHSTLASVDRSDDSALKDQLRRALLSAGTHGDVASNLNRRPSAERAPMRQAPPGGIALFFQRTDLDATKAAFHHSQRARAGALERRPIGYVARRPR
jgi:hypothetical protein